MSSLLAALVLAPALALAQSGDDKPIPYPDDEERPQATRRLPRHSEETNDLREESDPEQAERETIRAGFDDPNLGLSGELVGGLLLVEASRGSGVDARFDWGVRFTWEWSRAFFSDEKLREALFADVTWTYAALHDGTTDVNADTNLHYFTLAPAYALALGQLPISFYAQVGAGASYTFSSIHLRQVETQISGTKLLLQYGVGLRGRPALNEDGSVRLSFRLEVTRFRRGYMDDTLLGGSLGLTF